MLLVEARVGPSSIHGLGLFAQQFIPKGTPVWERAPGLDLALSQEQVDALPERARRAFLHYSFRRIKCGERISCEWILCFDEARFTNHSDDPNTDARQALRDVAPGDEITQDYHDYDWDFGRHLASTPISLAQVLGDTDPGLRYAAIRALSKVGLQDKAVVPQVAAALADPCRNVRYRAAKLLARLGTDAAPAVPSLTVALKDEDAEVRYYSAKCLSKVGARATDAVGSLIEALKDRHPKVRYYSAKALGKIGAAARAALEPLQRALDDGDKEVRDAAAQALCSIATTQ
jgi:hypothetical protein